MKKSMLAVFLVLVVAVIVYVVASDFSSKRPGRMSANPYELDVDAIKAADPSLVTYREVRNYETGAGQVGGIAVFRDRIYLGADDYLQVFDKEGKQLLKVTLPRSPRCLAVNGQGDILVGFRNFISLYSPDGHLIWTGDSLDDRAVFTCVRMAPTIIYVADAGHRTVCRYDTTGRFIDSFQGKTKIEGNDGFIVPSPYFDLAIDPDGQLWVVNPGKHAIEQYTSNGDLRGWWGNMNPTIDGFCGCCNPAHMDIMADGSFVTSEKGIVRIKIHKPSGSLATVVALPDKFKEDGLAPDIVVDGQGIVYALDYDRRTIRIFEPINKP